MVLALFQRDGYFITWKPIEEEIQTGAGEHCRPKEPWAMVNIDAVGYKNDRSDDRITTESVLTESQTPASPGESCYL